MSSTGLKLTCLRRFRTATLSGGARLKVLCVLRLLYARLEDPPRDSLPAVPLRPRARTLVPAQLTYLIRQPQTVWHVLDTAHALLAEKGDTW
jgi:hypothetical protein